MTTSGAASAVEFVSTELSKGLLRGGPLCQPNGEFDQCRRQLEALAACPHPKLARLEQVGFTRVQIFEFRTSKFFRFDLSGGSLPACHPCAYHQCHPAPIRWFWSTSGHRLPPVPSRQGILLLTVAIRLRLSAESSSSRHYETQCKPSSTR